MTSDAVKTVVHVEVLMVKAIPSETFQKNLEKQIKIAFMDRSLLLCRVYQETTSFRVTIGEAVHNGKVLADGFVIVDGHTELAFHFYQQQSVPMGWFQMSSTTEPDSGSSGDRYRLSVYPEANPSQSWETLVYEDQRQYDVLYELLVMQALGDPISGHLANTDILNCNRLALFTGPPGTGKTTLCKTLANKVAIRCGKRVFLAEINCQNILSKWFSESGKLIQSLFDELSGAVSSGKEGHENDLMFILFDEIESLLINRANLIGSSEPSDSIRAVNALLTQLDRLKECQRVFVLATSNFKEAIDPAFLSRVDIHFETGRPGVSATYRIMCEVLEELTRLHFISPVTLAGYETCQLQKPDQVSVEKALLSLCRAMSEDARCSGRWLRKLAYPALKEAFKMNRRTITITEFIDLTRAHLHQTSSSTTTATTTGVKPSTSAPSPPPT